MGWRVGGAKRHTQEGVKANRWLLMNQEMSLSIVGRLLIVSLCGT